MSAPELPEVLGDVLARHQRIVSKPGGPCWCGEWPRDDIRRDTWMDHVAAHLARAVQAHVEGRVEAAVMGAASEVASQRDGYLDSPGLSTAWIAGWHSATDHHVARLKGLGTASTPDGGREGVRGGEGA